MPQKILLTIKREDVHLLSQEKEVNKLVPGFPICLIRGRVSFNFVFNYCFFCAEKHLRSIHQPDGSTNSISVYRDIEIDHAHFADAKSLKSFFNLHDNFCVLCESVCFLGIFTYGERQSCWMSAEVMEEFAHYKQTATSYFMNYSPYLEKPYFMGKNFREKMSKEFQLVYVSK